MVNHRSLKRIITRSLSLSKLSSEASQPQSRSQSQQSLQQQQQQPQQHLKISTLELTEDEKRAVSERFTGGDRLPDNIGYIDEDVISDHREDLDTTTTTTTSQQTVQSIVKRMETLGVGFFGGKHNAVAMAAKRGGTETGDQTTGGAPPPPSPLTVDCHIDYFETESHIELLDLLLESDSDKRGQKVLMYSCCSKQPRGPRTALKVTFYEGGKYDTLNYKMARNEALLLQQLRHSHIVRFYESKDVFLGASSNNNNNNKSKNSTDNSDNSTTNNNPTFAQQTPTFSYLRMELLACSLEQVLAEGFFFTEQQAGRLLDQLSSALAYLHRCAIAHHDLTPSNVLLDRLPARGALSGAQYKLADLSSAQLYPNSLALEYLPLGAGVTYFAPEKATQYWHGYSPFRADIFSLALVAIEAMANFGSCPAAPGAQHGRPLQSEADAAQLPWSAGEAPRQGALRHDRP
ncbi:hypothetical protein TYRP_011908 [Tyrophagus putrescentiae]|nr:hypothetical protein TYRP_011908 [Tyrophagus putrescentiae]